MTSRFMPLCTGPAEELVVGNIIQPRVGKYNYKVVSIGVTPEDLIAVVALAVSSEDYEVPADATEFYIPLVYGRKQRVNAYI